MAENRNRSRVRDQGVDHAETAKVEKAVLLIPCLGIAPAQSLAGRRLKEVQVRITSDSSLACLLGWLLKPQTEADRRYQELAEARLISTGLLEALSSKLPGAI